MASSSSFSLREWFAHQGVGSHQAGHDGCGAAAQAPCWRHGKADPCFEGDGFKPSRFPDPLGCAVHEVVRAAAQMAASLFLR